MQTDSSTSKTWRDRLKRPVRWAVYICIAVMVVCVVAAIVVPPSRTYHEGAQQVVHIYPIWVFMLAFWAVFFTAVALLGLLFVAMLAGSRTEAACSFIAVIFGIASFVALYLMVIRMWYLEDTLRVPTGRTYAVLTWGVEYAFAQEIPGGWMDRRFEIRAISEPRSYHHLIRPAGSDMRAGHLYFTPDGNVVAMYQWGRCLFFADLRQDRVLALWDLEHLSPFVLLGPNDRPMQEDVKWLRSDPPAREELVSALDNPNPEVRKIVRELIDKMVEDAKQVERTSRELIDKLDQDVRQQERAAKERAARTQPAGR